MKIAACFCVLISLSAIARAEKGVIYLGMLEDVPGVYSGEGHSTKVRALFSYQDGRWKAFSNNCQDLSCLSSVAKTYPKEVSWYIGLDGHQVGKVSAITPDKFDFYSHIGLQDIPAGDAPIIGKTSVEFSGFDGEPVRRPLVAVSKPNFRDPLVWKQEKVTRAILREAFKLLHNSAPQLCKWPDEDKSMLPYAYGPNDLVVRAHKSRQGSQLLTIDVKSAYYCQGGDGEGGFESRMFAIDPNGVSHYLGPGLMLVDAGDYTGDGSSELITSLSLYNRGGYVLFSGSFSEMARYEFFYH